MTALVLALVMLGTGGGLCILSLNRLRRGRLVSGCAGGATGIAGLAAGAALGLLALDLTTYARLSHEAPVATLRVLGRTEGAAVVELDVPSWAAPRRFSLPSDEWQLDARVLKWRPWANVLGLDARYRLERLGARPAQPSAPRGYTGYSLPASAPWVSWLPLDVWWLAREGWLPGVDATYGSSVYGPLARDAVFTIRMTQSGLLARPRNRAAREAIRGWR